VLFLPGFDPWTLQPVVDLLVGFLVLVPFEIDNISVGNKFQAVSLLEKKEN